jgi:hypothetical protein
VRRVVAAPLAALGARGAHVERHEPPPHAVVHSALRLLQPRFEPPRQAAAALGGTVTATSAYWRALPREAQSVFGQVSVGGR